MSSYACASRVGSSLADGDYELVPAQGEGEEPEGQLNAVEAHEDAGQASEEPATNPVPEGKPRSMSYDLNHATLLLFMLVHLRFRSCLKTLVA